MSDFIWVEKYRPKTIEDCILPESTKTMFREFLNTLDDVFVPVPVDVVG